MYGNSKNSAKREVYSNSTLLQETSEISNEQSKLHLKQLQKEQENSKSVEKRNHRKESRGKWARNEECGRKHQ